VSPNVERQWVNATLNKTKWQRNLHVRYSKTI